MRLKILFIAIVLLTGLSIQQCTTGCLRCNNQNQCLLCDVTNNYRLVANTCQLNTLVSCLLANQDNTCALCMNGWYVDPNTRSCLQVASANVVGNCLTYSSSQVCTACGPNFYLSLGACVAIKTTIPFCRLYSADGVCSLCEPAYVRSGTDNACVSLPTGDNCLYYTFIKCIRCNPNYVQNSNLYFTNWVRNEHVITQYLHPLILRNQYWYRLQVCQLVTVTNCLEASAFNACTKCQTGYYLQGGLCFIYPDAAILNCATYSSLTVCTACKTGFYLDQNTCKANTNVANCLTHSTTALSVCTLCNSAYYVSNGACVLRTLTNVQNCDKYDVSSDTCSTCTGSLVKTTDGTKCLAAVPNCKDYEATTSSSTAHSCSLCVNGYYKTASGTISICTAGTVANCLTYSASANTCTVCQNQYYLDTGLCKRHVDIVQCKTYDPANVNICSVCNSGYFAFKHSKVCTSTTLVQNCKTYDDTGACTVCNDRFYLSAGKCEAISVNLKNCLTTSDNTICTKCDYDNGWVLANVFTNTNCTQVPDYLTNFCKVKVKLIPTINDQLKVDITTNDLDNKIFCEACGDYQVPFTISHFTYLCVNPIDLKLYKGYNAVLNCKRYGLNVWGYPAGSAAIIGEYVVCHECASGYYLTGYANRAFYTTTGLACSQTCSLDANMIVHDNYNGFINLCISLSSANTDAVGAPLFYVSSDSGCQKMARFRYIKHTQVNQDGTGFPAFAIANKEQHDFTCYIAKTPASPSTKKYYLAWNGDDDMYSTPYEGALLKNPNPTGFFRPTAAKSDFTKLTQSHYRDYGGGYSNTVDKDSVYPTVFNYLGLLPFFQVLEVSTATAALNFKNNNLNNCDIIYKYTAIAGKGRLGYAFNTHADQSAKYDAADITNYKLTCLRCAFGYMLSYTASTTAANNPAFPSCVTNAACLSSSTVMGGLPTYLNSLFSCHVCGNRVDNVRLYPSVWIEVDSDTGNAINRGMNNGAFVGWGIKDAYTSVTAVDDKHGFKCAPAPDEVVYGTIVPAGTPDWGSVLNCAAFGYITSLTAFTTPADTTATTSSTLPSATNTYKQVPICLACAANTFPEYAFGDSTTSIVIGNIAAGAWPAGKFINDHNLPTYYVKKCTETPNCDRSVATSYNTCTRCLQDDYSTKKYYAFIDYTLTKCVPVTTPNCFIANGNSDVSNNCQLCKNGYLLNDNACQRFRVPNMPNSAVYDNNDLDIILKDWTNNSQLVMTFYFRYQSLLKAGRTTYFGPSECNKDYFIFPVLRYLDRICAWLEYDYNAPDAAIAAGSPVIQNCKVYKYPEYPSDSDITALPGASKMCHECVEGFIPTDNFQVCTAKLPNCVYAEYAAPVQCKTCVSGYTPVAGFCTANNIAHCQTFGVTLGALVCSKCLPGFYYDSTNVKCLQGLVQNCKEYAASSATQCSICMDNFTLIALNNNKYYCYPLPSSLNCAELDGAVFDDNPALNACKTGKCKSTATTAFKLEDWIATPPAVTIARSVCMPFSSIANCKTYSETATNIVENTFSCTECVTGYWYSAANFTCATRQTIPPQCTEFEKTQDLCKTCDSTTYISADKKKCVLFPTGVANCIIYSSATTCTSCASGYYLKDNACVLSTVITSCNVYSNENVCSACLAGFLLVNPTTCTQLTATNCLTATDLNTCATCSPGFGLKVDGTVTNCVDNLVLLSNCVTATQVFPFKCVLCSPAYYLNAAGECVAITRLIPYCAKYDTASTCEICVNGTVLNLTRTSCDKEKYANEVDGNCLESQLLANPTCTQCASGFYFSNGACVACSSNTYNSGCLSCDPNNNGLCLVCRPTFYMNSQGACVSSSLIVNNPTGPTAPQVGSSMVNKALTVTLTLATLYYDQL